MDNFYLSKAAKSAGGIAALWLFSGAVFAQNIGGMTLGIDPILDVSCQNLTNPQDIIVPNPNIGNNTWSCTDLGMTAVVDDEIVQTVTGTVVDPVLVGARTEGLAAVTVVDCLNNNNGDIVSFIPNAMDWNCIDMGLIVNPGDTITQNINGIAQGDQPPVDPPIILTATVDFDLVVLNWTPLADAVTYVIHRSVDPVMVFDPTSVIGESSVPEYFDAGAKGGSVYYYAIMASDASGNSIIYNVVEASPLGIIFDHSTVANESCTTCHANDMSPNHLPTTADCNACHTTDAWIIGNMDGGF